MYSYVKPYLVYEIQMFGDSLLRTLDGATPTTIDKRVMNRGNEIHYHCRKKLINLVLTLFPQGEKEKEIKLRIYFQRLHRQLYDKWQDVLRLSQCLPMDEDVEDSVLQERLAGSESMIYYLAGWLILKLLHCKLRGLDSKVLSDFAAFNSLSADQATASRMPSDEVDRRENKKVRDAMKRPSRSWFDFVCLLEALYMVNMTAVQVLHHRGKVLEEITATTRRSVALRQLFNSCIPGHFGTEARKSLMRAYYLLILPCYGKMKSSDILWLERESGPVAPSSDTLPTRLKVLIAHENAKGL